MLGSEGCKVTPFVARPNYPSWENDVADFHLNLITIRSRPFHKIRENPLIRRTNLLDKWPLLILVLQT